MHRTYLVKHILILSSENETAKVLEILNYIAIKRNLYSLHETFCCISGLIIFCKMNSHNTDSDLSDEFQKNKITYLAG